MLNSWFRALRDPTPSASGPDERESRGEHISSTLYESSSGVKVVSLRGGEGESGQRASNEASGPAVKTLSVEGRGDLIEPSRNGVDKQGFLTPTSEIETQNGNERCEQQKDFGEGNKQGPGADDMSISLPLAQKQEDGMTSNRLQETTQHILPSSGDMSSNDMANGGGESGTQSVQAQVHGGHTSRFFASLFGAGDKAAASAEASPNVQNNMQNGQPRSSGEGKHEEGASSSLVEDEDEEEKEMTLFSSPREGDKRQDSEKKRSIDDFSMVRVLGQGSYGKVVLVRKKDDGVLYAMKVFNKHDVVCKRQVERTKIERRVLGYVDHPFLMKLHYAFQTGQKLYLVLDYCPGGELFFHLSRFKRFPEGVVRFYSAELVLALQHLHDSGIIYRDIKPENILLDRDGHLKLGDFGLAKDGINQATTGAQSVCGTPEYMAPEVISKAGHGTAVDWWGLGMLMYEMLTGLPPWYTKDRQKLFERLRSAPLVIPKTMSPSAASIISGMLTRNPARRLGAGGPKQVMGHEFFRGLDWKALLEKRIKAPLNPCRNQSPGSSSTQNFDPQFTRMPINTVSAPGSAGDEPSFDGFSYATEVGLAKK